MFRNPNNKKSSKNDISNNVNIIILILILIIILILILIIIIIIIIIKTCFFLTFVIYWVKKYGTIVTSKINQEKHCVYH